MPNPVIDLTQEELNALLVCRCGNVASFDYSYHEDNNRCPRDFWNIKIECGCGLNTGWITYGKMEEHISDPSAQAKAEREVLCIWNGKNPYDQKALDELLDRGGK